MTTGLTSYHILGKLTSQTNKERYDVCWKKKKIDDDRQPSYQRIHDSVCTEEPMYIRARQDHSGKNLDISTFSHKKIVKKDSHNFCIMLDLGEAKIQ